MKQAATITLLSLFVCATLAFGQGPPAPPKPGPELQKLGYFAGTWRSTGELKPGPMGPGGKFSEVTRSAWMPGNFFLTEHTTTSGALGHLVEVSYLGYSTEDKAYTYDAFNSLGQAEHAKGTVEGDTWTWSSTEKMGGQTMKGRFTITVTSPTSYSFKFEIAPESGDYSTVVEGKATKVTAGNTTKGAEGAASKK